MRTFRPLSPLRPARGHRHRHRGSASGSHHGFTLIELIVVMAIVALLASIATPRYLQSLDRAREASLRTSLQVMRHAIAQYAADRGRYPDSLQALVDSRYLRQVPEDPVTGLDDSWVLLAPAPDSVLAGPVWDVRSGAAGRARDGGLYADW